MSIEVYKANTTVPDNTVPCLGGSMSGDVKTVQVKVGDVVNITFPGTPPLRIARTGVKRPGNSTSQFSDLYCGYSGDPNITSNTFMWTVGPYDFQGASNITLGDVGSSVIFAAIEYGGSYAPSAGRNTEHPYWYSANLSVVTEISAAEAHRAPPALKSGLVVGLLVLPLLLGSIL